MGFGRTKPTIKKDLAKMLTTKELGDFYKLPFTELESWRKKYNQNMRLTEAALKKKLKR